MEDGGRKERGQREPQSKIVHLIRNKVPFGMHTTQFEREHLQYFCLGILLCRQQPIWIK